MIHKFSMNDLNIVVDVNGGAVHVVDEITFDVLDYYELNDAEKIAKKLPKYTLDEIKETFDEIKSLVEDGLLYSPDNYLDIDAFKNREPVVKAMCLHIAHDCNLKCKYCFASQGDFGGAKSIMSFEVGKKALEYLVDNSGSRKNLEVDFFGGEPLMNFEVVKQLVEYGNELAKEKGKNFRFTITTNGVLLDDEIIDYVNEHMHNVVLSLDGRKSINDDMRPTLNDKGSYDIIVPKFQKLIEKRKDKYYYVRGTFTRDNMDFSKDVLHFKDLGFDLTSVEPVVGDESNPYALREEDLPKILDEYEKLAVEYSKMRVNNEPFRFFHFMVDLSQGPCVIKRMTGCGAGNEYLAITPEGDIYPCHQFVGQEEFKMGNVMADKVELPKEMQETFKEAHIYAKDECSKCWAKFYCSGGCHANAFNFNNDILKPYDLGCQMQRKRLECALMVEASVMMNQDELEPLV
ncbi:putative radical SAM family protein [Acetoanaerobium sticklandii]|uniref:Putative radical SAM family protein n=1 Tax=Acetoanaerobium sticklandii (strain ATCC 12662 / DSM 519 / JCM 1433 / CCUG 9281 / NCIMB 10654 / HF) TaxID=499177 RepID=E3PWY3_ACESD|nr:thioether cross-link-forming SCIFF peptide maturase [Acetoanaerobium sticklandii]CBH20948.1 putative radical SAM family protein [Acetoanaerobium sticklandii]